MALLSYKEKVLWLAALAGLATYVGFTIWLAVAGLLYPYQLDYGEGIMLEQARLLSQGKGIYKGLEGYPYAFSNYPPLMQAVAALLIPYLGINYAVGRIWNVLSLGLLGLFLYYIVKRQIGDQPVGTRGLAPLLASLAFLGSPYIYHWAPLFRIDLPALLLTVLGLLAVRRSPILAGLLFTLSLYTKHSYLAGPAAAFIYLLLQQPGAALRLAGTMLSLGGGAFLWLNYRTAGAFYFDLVTANMNPFEPAMFLAQIMDFLRTYGVLLSLAAYAIGVRVREAWGPPDISLRARALLLLRSLSLWDFYLATAISSMAMAGKVGSWENYFFEPLFTVCLYAGLGIAKAKTLVSPPHGDSPQGLSAVRRLLIPVLLLGQLGLMFHTPAIAWRMMQEDGQANRQLAPLVANTPGPILSEDMGLLVTNGKEVAYFGFEYTQLARMGLWDQSWELEMLRSHGFPLVILEAGTRENPEHYSRFTRRLLSEMDRHYGLAESIGKYRLYRPAPLQRELAADFSGHLRLLGYRLEADGQPIKDTIRPGRNLCVDLLWQAQQSLAKEEDYTVFVHLLDARGERWAQHDGRPLDGLYPTYRWAKGEMVRDRHCLPLPSNLPEGRYIIQVGLYTLATGKRLALAHGADSLPMAAVFVGPRPTYTPAYTLDTRLGDTIRLVGYDLSKEATRVRTVLYWQTAAYLERDYTVFVHLSGPDGKPLAQHDGQPQGGTYPTSLWHPGEVVPDEHVVPLPPTLPPGEYRLAVGMYLLESGQRLPVAGGGDQVLLGRIRLP